MGEEKAKGGMSEWLKAAGSSLFGLLSGAALMYVTPLVNSAIKPPEPTANFGYQAQGTTVTFQNRSTNATDGWWDFGDGSALEQYSAQQPTITHSYTRPGPYTVKLSLTNLFNEKAERSVTVNVDGGATVPVIESFEVVPPSSGPTLTAPANFHLLARVKNADEVIWWCGETKPIELSTDTGGTLDHWVTIDKPGTHTFRIIAISGKQVVEKRSAPVEVSAPGTSDRPMATVTVAYEATRVVKCDKAVNIALHWHADCRDHLCPVNVEWLPPLGFHITKAELASNGPFSQVRGVPTVTVAPDGSKVVVSAELVRPANFIAKFSSALHTLPLHVCLEQRGDPTTKAWNIPMCLNVPGQTVIPLPAPAGYWQATKRQVSLDLNEGVRKIWSSTQMPVNQQLQLQGHPVLVNATVQGNQLVLTVTGAQAALPAIGN